MEQKVKVHKTTVAVDLEALKSVESVLMENWKLKGLPKTGPGRSEFLAWNQVAKMLESLEMLPQNSGNVRAEMEGSYSGKTTRVYYNPSYTSKPKLVRKAIVPTDSKNKFLFMDLKCAEFVIMCKFAGMKSVVEAYERKEDVYEYYKDFFPKGTKREFYKTALISNLYGATGFSVGKRLGISSSQGDTLLYYVNKAMPELGAFKRQLVKRSKEAKDAQYSPEGKYFYAMDMEGGAYSYCLPQGDWAEESVWSTFGQSTLGWLMQKFIKELEKQDLVIGTFLTVFDSILVEVSEGTAKKVEELATKMFKPLYGEFRIGDSFYEAAYGTSKETHPWLL